MLMTAPSAPIVSVRSRFLIRVGNCATYRSKKIPERPRFCHMSPGQRADAQPDDESAERSFH